MPSRFGRRAGSTPEHAHPNGDADVRHDRTTARRRSDSRSHGKIVVAGRTSIRLNAVVYRLNPDGSPDPAFNGDGAVGLDNGGFEEAYGVALQPNGKIVLSGWTSVDDNAIAYCLNPNGSPDTTFGLDGARPIAVDSFEAARAAATSSTAAAAATG